MRSNLPLKSMPIHQKKLFPKRGEMTAKFLFAFVFCLCFTAAASSVSFGQCPLVNQIANPGNEAAPVNLDGAVQGAAPGWTVTSGNFGGVSYGASYFGVEILPAAPVNSPPDRGNNVFYGGNAASNSTATQVYVVPAACRTEINLGAINFSLSGWFGGYDGQDDRMRLSVTFRDAASNQLGPVVTIGDVLAADRMNQSGLLLRAAIGQVPVGTATITFALISTYTATDLNNGYADNLSFVFVPTTAAGATISGRVTDATGRGIARARLVLTGGPFAQPVYATTNPFGYYSFSDLPAGNAYVVTVSSKRYAFEQPARLVNLGEDLTEINFVGQ